MQSKESKAKDPLTIALQMREAIGYLAVVASRSELDKIARKLLGVHLDLGAKIDALIEQQKAEDATLRTTARANRKPARLPH